MSVNSVNANGTLSSALQAQGLSADKISLVERDLQKAETSVSGGSGLTIGVDPGAVRAALDKIIADDVASGKLTQADADKIGEGLDAMEAAASSGTAAGGGSAGAAPGAGGGGGGGGGGSSESEKTELSRTVTVAGGVKTTTILYTDGTSETETAVDLSAQDSTSAASAASASPDKATQDYLTTIQSGSLFSTFA